MRIILASASPRRKELLSNLGLRFEVIPADIDEKIPFGIPPHLVVMDISYKKAKSLTKYQEAVIIAADTIVVLKGEILGKPSDEAEALAMLTTLSNKTHSVYTGVAILHQNKERRFFEKTDVTFRSFDEEFAKRYIKTGEPLDKAGAYGIQNKGALLVKSIEGDYFNVVGLPISRLAEELKSFGIQLL